MKPTILVIEDDAVHRYLLTFYLKEHGYPVVEAANGYQGLDLARKEQPGLILMDIHMPGLDGLAVVEELRRDPVLGQVPMVAVTACNLPDDRARILSSGCVDHVEKPIDLPKLIALVEAITSRQRTGA